VANASIYSGTKGAIIALTKSLARELAPDVLVNAVAPDAIDTGMVRSLSPDRLSALVDSIPLKRLGTPAEVAFAILFLSSSEWGYLTPSPTIITIFVTSHLQEFKPMKGWWAGVNAFLSFQNRP